MKYKKTISCVLALMLGAILIVFGTVSAFADIDDESYDAENPPQTEYVDPEPQPETEEPQPVTEEPQPETEAPQPETEEPQPEPETEAPREETEPVQEQTQEQINNIDNGNSNTGTTEFFVPPTVPKTVSEKTYSTNYVFGITSWICVAVGIIVILSVLISTKAGGRNNRSV